MGDSLEDNLYIVGGNLDEIHDAIEDAILLGGHNLNLDLSTALDDDEWLAIAETMRSAYNDYADQLDEEMNSFEAGECNINCFGGDIDEEECVCGCDNAIDCCVVNAATITMIPIIGFAMMHVYMLCV